MKRRAVVLVCLAGVVVVAATCNEQSNSTPGIERPAPGSLHPLEIEVTEGGETRKIPIQVELAVGSRATQKGLMFRNSLPASQGMLFLFKERRGPHRPGSLTMRNCKIPLTVAFLEEDGTIVQLTKMDIPPAPEDDYVCTLPHRFWLEMNQGFFEGHGVAPGDRVVIPRDFVTIADQWGE